MDHEGALEAVGRRLAATQDQQLDEASLAEARRRFVDGAPAARRRASVWLLAAAAATVVAVVVVLFRPSPPLRFEVAGRAGQARAWVQTDREEIPMTFSDGTSVLLRGNTRARVAQLSAEGAVLAVERGEVTVDVVPKNDARWRFEVGPFDVRVTGTQFDVGWDPHRQVFTLEMHHGSVVLEGPTLGSGRSVVAGQRLQIDVGGTAAAVVPSASAVPPPPSASASASASSASAPDSTPSIPSTEAASPSWRALATEGKYAEALTAAEAAGFSGLLQSGSVADLTRLADIARLGGASARAREAYLAIRERFPGTPAAAVAAFALGRMSGSAKWMRVYLQEAPQGSLAREALGRVLEAEHQAKSPQAEATAQQYLARYPGGPHSKLARSVLGR